MSFFADAGLPMIALAWPWIFIALAPIIAIEIWTARLPLEISLTRKTTGIGVANVISTLVGWPIAWIVMVLLQLYVIPGGGGAYDLNTPLGAIASVTVQAAWLAPYEESLYWMVPVATAVLMIPFFIISVFSEDQILRLFLRGVDPALRRRAVWRANLFSYGFLIAMAVSWLSVNLVLGPKSLH